MKGVLSKEIPHFKTIEIKSVEVPLWDEFSFENVIKELDLKDNKTLCKIIPEIKEDRKVVRDREFFFNVLNTFLKEKYWKQ